jgi:hypothetical protein
MEEIDKNVVPKDRTLRGSVMVVEQDFQALLYVQNVETLIQRVRVSAKSVDLLWHESVLLL